MNHKRRQFEVLCLFYSSTLYNHDLKQEGANAFSSVDLRLKCLMSRKEKGSFRVPYKVMYRITLYMTLWLAVLRMALVKVPCARRASKLAHFASTLPVQPLHGCDWPSWPFFTLPTPSELKLLSMLKRTFSKPLSANRQQSALAFCCNLSHVGIITHVLVLAFGVVNRMATICRRST